MQLLAVSQTMRKVVLVPVVYLLLFGFLFIRGAFNPLVGRVVTALGLYAGLESWWAVCYCIAESWGVGF